MRINIKLMEIKDIKPYDKNAKKHTKKQVEQVARSIKEFGWQQPIVISEDNVVIVGHCRLLAAKLLKYETVPCVVAANLSDEQIKALRLADNKTNESKWDYALLRDDFQSILNINIRDFGFTANSVFKDRPKDYKQSKNLNNFFKSTYETVNEWGIPETKPFKADLTDIEWVSFGEKFRIKDFSNVGIHFYIDDYKFESVWTTPDKWLDMFKKCRAVITPDFSNYTDMPKAQHLWNHYRRQWCGKYWQEHGVNVVSSLSWGNGQIYDFSFLGIPQGTTVAVSFVGDAIDKQAGVEELKSVLAIVKPYKVYIKANKKDETGLRPHIDFGIIPPYNYRRG